MNLRLEGHQPIDAAGAGARKPSFLLLAVAMLAIGLDVGVARITYESRSQPSRGTCNSA